MTSADLGRDGERWALRHLYREGYDVLERNFRCRSGEVDIVAYDGSVLAFIEVKTGTLRAESSPAETFKSDQQQRIRSAADTYRRSRKLTHLSYRFDMVSVEVLPRGRTRIKLVKHAF